jgi:hypothetical protein
MTRFPSNMAGTAILTGAPSSPQTDIAAALHAEYAGTVERYARVCAGIEPDPEVSHRRPDIEAMFNAEDRIMAEPTQSLAMLALRLMATFCTFQRCEDDNTCALDPLRQMRDEAAALAGLAVVDEWEAVERLRKTGPLHTGSGCSPAIAALLAKLRVQQAERDRLRPPAVRPSGGAGEYNAQQDACDAAAQKAGATLNALVATPSETPADLFLKVALLHGEEADFACNAWQSWAETLAAESRRFGGRP